MAMAERAVGDVTIVDVTGSITIGAGGAEQLADKVRSLLQQGRKKLVVNLAELVQAYSTTMRHGGALKLLNATSKLKDLLTITKLATVFELFDAESDAVASF
jgi:hypothetical protein